MLILLLVGASVVPAAPAPRPSKEFVQACYEKAKGQAELNFCAAGEAEAKNHDISDAAATACFDRELTQSGMNMCAGEEFARADKALNEQWARAKEWAKDDAQTRTLLLASQHAWLKYRDAQCRVVADENRGGSIVPLVRSSCLTNLTRDRTKELANLIKPWDER